MRSGELAGGSDETARAWQVGVWDRMSDVYLREVDRRFVPVVEHLIRRANLKPGDAVLDLGTGTGAAAFAAAPQTAPNGQVIGVDISQDMLELARRRAKEAGLTNLDFREGGAEAIPVGAESVDVVLASLSLMYVVDRGAAAKEIARVLRQGGRIVASVWAGPEECDIVRFQQTAGSFAPPPPAPWVGPGALADPAPFLGQLREVGIDTNVETEMLEFDFEDFDLAWDVLAGVTAVSLDPKRRDEAKAAVQARMWTRGEGPRHFRNVTQFVAGVQRA